MPIAFFTIGHSTRSIEEFVGLLQSAGVRFLVDVRTVPRSRVRRSKIEWIGVRHEEGAALAAAGQAKLTGRLGVCAGTTGPGSTHLVAGRDPKRTCHRFVIASAFDPKRTSR